MSCCISGSVRGIAFMSALGVFPIFADSDVGTKNLEGFFIGVDAAYSHSSLKNDETGGVITLYADNTKEEIPESERVRSKHKRVHVDPSINIGYSHFFGNYYLGLAGDISFGNDRKSFVVTDSDDDEGYETRIGGVSYGIKAKGGYYLSGLKSVVYGVAGVKWRDASYRRYLADQFGSKAKLKSPSFLLGLGFEHSICKKLSLSAEYEYSWRSSSDNTLWKNGELCVDYNIKQKLREHALKVGVKYHI